MSWLSEGWKKLTGQNQKVKPKTIGSEWDEAYGGLQEDYSWLQDQGKEMMDPYSAKNMGAYRRFGQQSAEGLEICSVLQLCKGGVLLVL